MQKTTYRLAPKISARLDGSTVLLKPRTFLGAELFDAWRAAVGTAGRYDKVRKIYVCPRSRYGEIVAAMEAANFTLLPESWELKNLPVVEAEKAAARVKGAEASLALVEKVMPPYGYQREGVVFLATRRRALLADDQGLGKTYQVLAALPSDARVLVECPAVARSTWSRDAAALRPDLRVVYPSGPILQAPKPGEMLICSYEDITRRVDLLDEKSYGPVRPLPQVSHLVVDEAHYLKNRKSRRTRAHIAVEAQSEVAWLLSGTPMPNAPMELWQVLESAGLAHIAFGTWDRFVDLFGGTREKIRTSGNKFRTIVTFPSLEGDRDLFEQIRAEVRPLLAQVMLRRRKKEVLKDLPDKRTTFLDVEVDQAVLRECEVVLENERLDASTITDETALPLHAFAPIRKQLALAKLPAAIELVEQHEETETPLVVFSAHRAPVEKIGGRKGWARIDGEIGDKQRRATVEAFQAGELKGVACTITAAGTSLTLTHASDELFVDLDWSPGNNAQASDRCHRIGQKRGVLITVLQANHPLDRRMSAVLSRKMLSSAAAIG